MMSLPILSVVTATPLVGALVVAAIPSKYPDAIRRTALTFALVAWVMSLGLLAAFAFNPPSLATPGCPLYPGFVCSVAPAFQYVEAHNWIPAFGIQIGR